MSNNSETLEDKLYTHIRDVQEQKYGHISEETHIVLNDIKSIIENFEESRTIYIVNNYEGKAAGAFTDLIQAKMFNDICSEEHRTFRGEGNPPYTNIQELKVHKSKLLCKVHNNLSKLKFSKNFGWSENNIIETVEIDGKIFKHERKPTEEEMNKHNSLYDKMYDSAMELREKFKPKRVEEI